MTKIRRRQRCPKCGSLNIILWGSRNGRQRYRCKDCERSFVRCNENVSQNNRFVWFRRWVLGKQTLMDIAKESGYSERHLRRWFDGYLYKAPLWTIKRRAGIKMLVDGTWLDREHCLIVYRDNASKSTVYYRFASAEKEYEIIKDLEAFKQLNFQLHHRWRRGYNKGDKIRLSTYDQAEVHSSHRTGVPVMADAASEELRRDNPAQARHKDIIYKDS